MFITCQLRRDLHGQWIDLDRQLKRKDCQAQRVNIGSVIVVKTMTSYETEAVDTGSVLQYWTMSCVKQQKKMVLDLSSEGRNHRSCVS